MPNWYGKYAVNPYQLQNSDFHHTLVEIRGFVLDNFDSDDLVCLHVLAFHHLAECALAKNIEDQVPWCK